MLSWCNFLSCYHLKVKLSLDRSERGYDRILKLRENDDKIDSIFVTTFLSIQQVNNRDSQSSDTSSAYSGSDTISSIHSIDPEELDLSGLIESVVDSDEEDLPECAQVKKKRKLIGVFFFFFF